MKKNLLAVAVLLFAGTIFAQSADKITEILNTERITYSQAAYISVCALGDELSEEDAFEGLKTSGVISTAISASDEITLKKFARICANTWQIKGSMFLAICKTPRYVLRQMKADGVIDSSLDPDVKLSGREALAIITDCIGFYKLRNDSSQLESEETVEETGTDVPSTDVPSADTEIINAIGGN